MSGTGARLPFLAVAAVLAASAPAVAQELPVDLELVLAVDASWSMDVEEQRLQRAGYVAALTHPEVVGAIQGGGAYGRIAVTYMEWAGPSSQVVMLPWRVIEDRASAEAAAGALAEAPTGRLRGTSISGGLAFAAGLFNGNGYEGLRHAIDISGDGPNNMGAPVEPTRDAVLSRGIVINGLPIMLRPSASSELLDRYYTDCVIGGPGSFVLPVNDPAQLAEAIRRKLVLEIAGLPATVVPVAAALDGRSDCLAGEKRWRAWQEP